MISWQPATNETSVLNTTRTIIIYQRYIWSKSLPASACTSATISSFGMIGETAVSTLKCESPTATCTKAQCPTNISIYEPCTDYNTALGISYGYSLTKVNLTVISSGIVLGYVSTGAWLTLQLGGAAWSLMVYINMSPRPDNQLINSSPTSNIAPIIYVPAGTSLNTSIDIPMNDDDGDDIECRFAKSSNILGGVTVDECGGVCQSAALPTSTQLITRNNTCTLIVSLSTIGYYAVAIQLEDFIENITTPLSSVPLQFLLLTYDASNPTSACTSIPIITSIPPDLPLPGDTITVQATVSYSAMVIAQSGCENDTDTSIINFLTSSPPGMLQSNLPFALNATSYAISLTWTPTINQLGQTYQYCAVAIDSNYHSSNQYCFNFLVGPKTTTTTTTSTTTSSTTSTSSTRSTTSSTSTSTSTTTTTTTTSTTISTTSTSTTSSTSTSTTSSTSTSTTSSTSTSTTSSTSTSTTSSTSTTTTSVTTTTSTSTTSIITNDMSCNYIPLALGLGLGLGFPLLSLLSLLSLCYLCRWFPGPIRSILQYRYGHPKDMSCKYCQRSILDDNFQKTNESKSTISNNEHNYRQQYLNSDENQLSSRPTTSYLEHEYLSLRNLSASGSRSVLSGPTTTTITSLFSPSINNLPKGTVERTQSLSHLNSRRSNSILHRLYSKQVQPI